ncbi:MAG: hypothetical protein ACK5WS_04930 [Alphaproteobacteria bacterium]|jgi:hypothetical protein|nr:hypothetical protein [Candidatus Jidaibacter sp.]
MLSSNLSDFSDTLKEDVRNLCWLQHKHHDDFMYIFCDDQNSLNSLMTKLANRITSCISAEGDTAISIVTSYNLHACEILVSDSCIKANIIVPFSKALDKENAKIIAVQSDIAMEICASSIGEYIKCSTSCFVSNNSVVIFSRLLQMYYNYNNAIDDVMPIFQPLLSSIQPYDINFIYQQYDRAQLIEDSKALVYHHSL